MPAPGTPAKVAPPSAETSRPSWLPATVEVPETQDQASIYSNGPVATQDPIAQSDEYAVPVAQMASPAWAAAAPPPSSSRTSVMVAAVAALALMGAGAGVWVWHQSADKSAPASTNPAAVATPSAAESARPSAVAQPLTAQLSGDYCPVAHPGNAACWKGSLVNTGPPIGKLAMIFVPDPPYSDWFAHHANGTLSGFYTTAGCDVDPAHSRIVCGPVSAGGEIDAYLGGDVTTRGTFNYAVKFADISSGSPLYVNQRPDGTHDVVTWREVIT